VPRDWRSVATVSGWQTAASLCYYSVFAATGFVQDAFALTESLVGFFLTATIVGYTLALFPSGAAVDAVGERSVMVAGLFGLAAATVAVSVAPSYATVLLAGAVLGATYASAMPGTNRGIVASAPRGRESFAMGLKQVGVSAGSGAASLVVTGVAAVAAWQVGFWVIAVVAAAYAVVFAVLYDGADGTGEFAVPDVRGLRANRAYVLLVGGGLFVGASIYAMLGYTVLYVEHGVGASAAIGGVVLAITQVTGSASRIGAGRLADRLGGADGAVTVAAGQVALAAALFAVLASGSSSLLLTVAAFAGLGLTIHGSPGVFYSCLSELVDDDDIGAATAGGQTAINVGGLLAPPLFGALVEYAGYGTGWALLAASAAVGAALLLAVKRRVRARGARV
jgi:MFS family permease